MRALVLRVDKTERVQLAVVALVVLRRVGERGERAQDDHEHEQSHVCHVSNIHAALLNKKRPALFSLQQRRARARAPDADAAHT